MTTGERVQGIRNRLQAYRSKKNDPGVPDGKTTPEASSFFNHAEEDIAYLLGQVERVSGSDRKMTGVTVSK